MSKSDEPTFRLPGHEFNPFAERKCLLSLISAYSKKWNPRNLEAPWYEPWGQIFADLVAGHPSLSVAPQPCLWYMPTSEPHTTPGPRHLLSTEDELLDDLPDELDVGNTTMDSIKSISAHRSKSRIPDFAITRRVSFLRPHNPNEISHLDRRVTYLGFPLLAELKASGARCSNISKGMWDATRLIGFARDQLSKQAFHLFQMYPHQQSVILIAISGFWWSYYFYPRPPSDQSGTPADAEEEEELDTEIGSPGESGIHDILRENPSDSEDSIEALKSDLYGFLSQDAPKIFSPQATDSWSEHLLYGTASSDQAMKLVLERLHSVVHVYYDGKMG